MTGTVVGGGTGGNVLTQTGTFNNTTLTPSTVTTQAYGVDTTATGNGARAGSAAAPAPGATAYGAYATAADANATAIGFRAIAAQAGSVAIGYQARAIGDPTVAVGDNSLASGNNAVAIGANTAATGNNSVALGQGSVADAANTVSVGSPGAERRITNVAPAVNPTDAVNLQQLRDVARQAYSGVAMSMAISGVVIPPLEAGEKGLGLGLSQYRGYSAVAMQFRGLASGGQAAYGIGVTTTGREWGVQLGIGFKWK